MQCSSMGVKSQTCIERKKTFQSSYGTDVAVPTVALNDYSNIACKNNVQYASITVTAIKT